MLDETAITETARAFSGELIRPADPGYERGRRVWNAMIDRRPALIARCTGPGDVVAALRLARRVGVEVAVRGGGHSVAGHSVADGALMIDLSPMTGVRVNPEARRVRAQGGCLLKHLDHATQRFGLATPTGVVSLTGIAGLTLGGGEGHASRLHGLTCDNLVSAEVVTADGELLVADEENHADLFWALRGGGGNFGIVTSFEFALHSIGPEVSVGDIVYAREQGMEALRAFYAHSSEMPDRMETVAGITTATAGDLVPEPHHGNTVVWLSFVYFGELEEGVRRAALLRGAGRPIAEHFRPMKYTTLQSLGDEFHSRSMRRFWKSSYLREVPDEAWEVLLRRGTDGSEGREPLCEAELFTLGGAVSRIGEEDTARSHRDAQFDFITTANWSDPAEDDTHIGSARSLWEQMAPFGHGVYVNNLMSEGVERVRSAYGPTKYRRLSKVKESYDPDNVFHLNHNIRPRPSG